jgi:hypothetical protein
MRIFVFILMLVTVGIRAADSSDPTTNITEGTGLIAPDDHIRFKYREENVYRGREKLMEIDSRENARGQMIVTSRQYYTAGVLTRVESDGADQYGNDNMGGRLENVALFSGTNLATFSVAMFTRLPDGSLRPVNKQVVDNYKKQAIAFANVSAMAESNTVNDVKKVVFSPDRKLKAVVFERNCGALCSFNRQITVIKGSDELPKHKLPGNFFYAENKAGSSTDVLPKIEMTWGSASELHVKIPLGLEIRTNAPPYSLKVTYERF